MVEKMHIMYGHKLSHYKEKEYFSFSTLEEPSACRGRGQTLYVVLELVIEQLFV